MLSTQAKLYIGLPNSKEVNKLGVGFLLGDSVGWGAARSNHPPPTGGTLFAKEGMERIVPIFFVG